MNCTHTVQYMIISKKSTAILVVVVEMRFKGKGQRARVPDRRSSRQQNFYEIWCGFLMSKNTKIYRFWIYIRIRFFCSITSFKSLFAGNSGWMAHVLLHSMSCSKRESTLFIQDEASSAPTLDWNCTTWDKHLALHFNMVFFWKLALFFC